MSNRHIASIKIKGNEYNIIASYHAMDRMNERHIDEYVVAGNVLALGKERIHTLQQNNDEAIIIDEVNNVSVVVGFNPNNITIITVINKSNVFVKQNTKVYNL